MCIATRCLPFCARKACAPAYLVCKIPLLTRRTRPMQPAGQARRATIGYLVYNGLPACSPTRACALNGKRGWNVYQGVHAQQLAALGRVRARAKVSCIQVCHNLGFSNHRLLLSGCVQISKKPATDLYIWIFQLLF